jgi:tellurite resistance protein TehA-like permease
MYSTVRDIAQKITVIHVQYSQRHSTENHCDTCTVRLYCTCIAVIFCAMSLTVLYMYHSDLSRYVSDCTVHGSQWFSVLCLWLYCTCIAVIFCAMSDCTVHVSQWFSVLCLWLYCTCITLIFTLWYMYSTVRDIAQKIAVRHVQYSQRHSTENHCDTCTVQSET